MALTIVAYGENKGLDLLTGKSTSAIPMTLRLFSNNATVSGATLSGDLTELTLDGYASIALTGASWSSASQSSSKGSTSYPTQTFNFTNVSAGNVYGLYVTNTSTGDLVAVEKWAVPRSVVSGDSLSVTLNLTLSSEA